MRECPILGDRLTRYPGRVWYVMYEVQKVAVRGGVL